MVTYNGLMTEQLTYMFYKKLFPLFFWTHTKKVLPTVLSKEC